MPNNWYIITGGPSTGKTTLLQELELLGHKTVPEAARTWIDENLGRGISVKQLRADEYKFQQDIAKLKAKIERAIDADALTFFDRGMHDTLAFMRHYGFPIEGWIVKLAEKSQYKKVFLLEPLAFYERDYARTEDQHFLNKIPQLLHDVYTEFGMKPISVPPISPAERAKFILHHIGVAEGAQFG